VFSFKKMFINNEDLNYDCKIPAVCSGWMLVDYAWGIYSSMGWLHAKLAVLALAVVYHYYCYRYLLDFKFDRNQRSHVFYRWFNEVPV
jgi:putative membrane protein